MSSAATPLPLHSRTIVIGLGNPILGDDGVGWRVVDEVKSRMTDLEIYQSGDGLEIDCLSTGGLALMERLEGFEKALIIDAITTGQKPAGSITCFPLDSLPNRALGHLSSSHDTTLHNALEVGRNMGARLPSQILIIAIETQQVFEFSDVLSLDVASAVPDAAALVLQKINPE